MSSIIQQIDHKKSETFKEGRVIRANKYPIIHAIPFVILMLLSYVSLCFSIYNFALNAIIHFPTNIDMIEEYINEVIAKIHTFQFMKQRYNPNKQPHNDSVNARQEKYLIAFFLIFFCQIMPIKSPAIEAAIFSKAIHCAGKFEMISLTKVGCEYEIKKLLITRLTSSQFWLLSG